jgi:hypothetical protein
MAGIGIFFWSREVYVFDILRRFSMEDCRLIVTPMVTNLKKVITSDSESITKQI